jgi:hypothetical protein
MPCGVKLKLPLAVAQSARVGASTCGSGVLITVWGCVSGVMAMSRTFVSVPVPLFSTVKPTVPVSQLSREVSRSPRLMEVVTP